MLNWADLSFIITLVVGPICGFCAAHSHNTGMFMAVLFALGGLAVAFLLGSVSRICAYSVLRSQKLSSPVAMIIYTSIPVIAVFAVVIVTVLAAELTLR